MRPIPQKMRQELEKLPRMKQCTLAPLQDLYGPCEGRKTNPEWHHVWMYAGKQINELWAILAGCSRHHRMATDPAIKAAFETASLMLVTPEDLSNYSRKDWAQIKKSLGMKL